MATSYTLTKHTNIRELTVAGGYSARTGGDVIANTAGFDFTIDQDSCFGHGSPAYAAGTAGSFGSMTITAASGGNIYVDGTTVWLIPFNTGSGTLATTNTAQTISSATAYTCGIYTALTSAPVTTGASGWLKVTNVSGTLPSSGSYTSDGFTYTITGAPVRGWIEVVGDDAATLTANRMGIFQVTGAYYEIGTTTGTRTTTYNIPNNGRQLWIPSIEVQGATWTITGATWAAGTATYTTSATHDMLVGMPVTVTGVTPSGYNVTDTYITDITDTTFKVAIVSDPGTYTSGGSAIAYEQWPCAGTTTALPANFLDENTRRGKVFWNTNATTSLTAPLGYVRFGHDGTNSTGGYCPPSGRKIRVGNVFFTNCTTAARNQNVLPNATLATRYDFTTTGAGQISISKASMCWYLSAAQAYSLAMYDSGFMSRIAPSELGTSMTMINCSVGQEAAVVAVSPIVQSLCPMGATFKNVVFTQAATTGTTGASTVSIATTKSLIMTDCVGWLYQLRTGAGTAKYNTWDTCPSMALSRFHSIGIPLRVSNCANMTVSNTKYSDTSGTRTSTQVCNAIQPQGAASSGVIDGLSIIGTRAAPWNSLVLPSASLRGPLKIRNFGTYANPVNTGDGPYVKSWSRTTTTCTVDFVSAHGMLVNDQIYVYWVTSTSAIALGAKTVTAVPLTTTLQFACTNGGDASGTLAFYWVPTLSILNTSGGANAENVTFQRLYASCLRAYSISCDNSNNNFTFENVVSKFDVGQVALNGPVALDATTRFCGPPNRGAATSQYGMTWMHGTWQNVMDSTSFTWTRSAAVIDLTSSSGYHNQAYLNTQYVNVTASNDESALNIGAYALTAPGTAGPAANILRLTGYATGITTGGTATLTQGIGMVAILMNEGTASNTHYTITAGTPKFTGAGTLSMFTIGDQIVFETPEFIKGHTGFLPYIPELNAGTIGNFHLEYQIDTGSGYSGWKTLYRLTATAVADGTAGANTITQVAAGDNWIADGDYVQSSVWGSVHRIARVASGGGTTTLTMDHNHNTSFTNSALHVYRLPSETINYSTGFKMKVRVTTLIANTTAIGAISFRTLQTDASRQIQYPLDTVPVTITVKDNATNAAVENARIRITTDVGGYTVLEGLTNASGVLTGTTEYAAHAITGTVRRASPAYGTLYKTGSISGTTTSAGFSATVLLIPDE